MTLADGSGGEAMAERNTARAARTKKRTRIQEGNEERILDAALAVFSRYGFRGATVDQIAARAGMSKPNLLYYFRRKQDIYVAVLQRTLSMWLEPFESLRPEGEPRAEIRRYIRRKLAFSRTHPEASRLFLAEVLQGAPMLRSTLEGPLRDLVERKAATIQGWIDQGKLTPVDPVHLIFTIWATTQHYADFDSQIRAVLGREAVSEAMFAQAEDTILRLFFEGLEPRGER